MLALAACASAPSSAPRSVLDEHTGVTISAVSEPIVFERLQQSAGGSVHDFVTLVALEKDNAGKYAQLLLLYRGRVAFNLPADLPPANAGRLILHVDDQAIELQPLDRIPVDLSLKALMAPEGVRVNKYAYTVDFATLRRIAASRELSVQLPQEDDLTLSLYKDGRKALAQLVDQLNGS